MENSDKFRFRFKENHSTKRSKSSRRIPRVGTGFRHQTRNLISDRVGKTGWALSSKATQTWGDSNIITYFLSIYNYLKPLVSIVIKVLSSRLVTVPILIILFSPVVLIVFLVLTAMFGVSTATIALFTITSLATFFVITFVAIPAFFIAAISGAVVYVFYTITDGYNSPHPKLLQLQQNLRRKLFGKRQETNDQWYQVISENSEKASEVDLHSGTGPLVTSFILNDDDLPPSPVVV